MWASSPTMGPYLCEGPDPAGVPDHGPSPSTVKGSRTMSAHRRRATHVMDAAGGRGCDIVLEPFTVLRGRTVIGDLPDRALTEIRDSMVGDRGHIVHSWLDGVEFGPRSAWAFSKLRPGTRNRRGRSHRQLAELVRSSVGRGSKAHVSYLGDTTVVRRSHRARLDNRQLRWGREETDRDRGGGLHRRDTMLRARCASVAGRGPEPARW